MLIFALIMSYFAGLHAGTMRCYAKIALDTSKQQTKIFEIQGRINAETVRHSADDIRRVLHEKYTITE